MVATSFYFPYHGNKQHENTQLTEIVEEAIEEGVKTCVEVFGGSLSFSRWLYEKYGNELEYLCSEIDEEVVNFCNTFKDNKEEVLRLVHAKTDWLRSLPTTEETRCEFMQYFKSKPETHIDKLAYTLFFRNNYGLGARVGLMPMRGVRPELRQLKNFDVRTEKANKFFDAVEYKCQDFRVFLEAVKDDDTALVYLDPPYLKTCNDFYKQAKPDEIFEYLERWCNECKCKWIIVHRDVPYLREKFSPYIQKTYGKKYDMKHKRVEHLVLSNIKTPAKASKVATLAPYQPAPSPPNYCEAVLS